MSAPRRRPLTSRDLLRLRTVSDPRLAPGDERVAWVCTRAVPERNTYGSDLMLSDLAGEGPEQVVPTGVERATHPRWSPDGRRLAFLAPVAPPRGGGQAAGMPPGARGPQLHLLDLDDGSVRRLTDLAGGVHAPAWSPDGRRIAFLTYVDPNRGLQSLADLEPPVGDLEARFTRDVLVARRRRWKLDGAGYLGNQRLQVAVLEVPPPGGGPVPAPYLPAGVDGHLGPPAWSPDGRRLAAVGNLRPEEDEDRRAYVYLVDPGGATPPVELFGLAEIRHDALAWSPSGEWLAVCGHDDPRLGHYGNQRLWIAPAAGGAPRCLTAGFDRTFGQTVWGDACGYGGAGGPRWLDDGSLLTLLSDAGGVRLVRVDEHGRVTPLTPGDAVVSAFDVTAAGDQAVVLAADARQPGDLFVVDLHRPEAPWRRLTAVNAGLLAEVSWSEPLPFRCRSGDAEIDGWVVPPVAREPGRRYPAILYHGGGPGGMRSSAYFFEFQLYAAQGYAVIYANTRGCQGYGEAFCTAILGDWGGADHVDNLAALEYACSHFDFIDPDRLAAAGGSYGGYHVNWILGHDARFRCAVSDRSISNRLSSWGTSDIGHLREFEFGGGPPWETTGHYLRQSPLRYIGRAATPTLVVHSDQDLRCPVEQGEQLYLALRRLGVPTELVRFQGENHGLSRGGRPWHRVFRLDRYLNWFQRYLIETP